MDDVLKQYIDNGGKIKKLPAIDKPGDRQKVNRRYGIKPQQEQIPFTDPACFREKIAFDHLPQAIIENVADMARGKELIELLRQIPLSKSVPLLMQYVLNATSQEIADYHKISRSAVYKNNKSSLKILHTLMKYG